MNTYTAVLEKCPGTGLFVGYVPDFPGAHSQAESLDELNRALREVIEMLIEEGGPTSGPDPAGKGFESSNCANNACL